VLGFFVFAWVTIGALFALLAVFATTSSP